MSSNVKNPDLHRFLKQHYYDKEKHTKENITHTRISDKKTITGGSYCIPDNKLSEFNKLYYKHVFTNNNMEFLTEKQPDIRPIMVDFDFRYSTEIKSRQHTKDHIADIIELYLDELKTLIEFEEKAFPIYILEKKTVNTKTDSSATKDGIHMIIGILMDSTMQLILRDKILEKIETIWDGLPLTNTWDSVLDKGISAGHTNWQLIGSRKPNNEPYKITDYFEMCYDNSDEEFTMEQKNVKDINTMEKMMSVSVRCKDYPSFDIKEQFKKIHSEKKRTSKPANRKFKIIKSKNSIDSIKNMKQLDDLIEEMIENPEPHLYYIKETHEYTMLLPSSYYESGSYDKWIRVAMALHNTDSERLFITWVKLSAKAKNFDFRQIPDMKN